ncbi:MAG: GTP 3',8-cyclase MoaA [Alphaproteobacteria bacterium]|nr:GTP 3',8-cyclase MoaA [Alphaproteobacteria bacterium]
MDALTDSLGRVHTYLRVSVTDRCNYRCTYCMPAEGMSWMPRADLLTYEEIGRVVGVFAGLGIRRVRITGGEPLIRRDIDALVASVAGTPGIRDVAMTTNAHHLARLADRLAAAGLSRINVSLDSLVPERFARLTRGGDLARVLDGIQAARDAGLGPIKINAVLLEGENDDEIDSLVDYFARWADDTELRFIEYMPFEARWHRCVPAAKVREQLSRRFTLAPRKTVPGDAPPGGIQGSGAGPARTWVLAENGLTVGFISPLTEHFCATCNRLRLMADGHLRTCLAHEDTPSLRDLIRGGADDPALADAIRAMVLGKPWGHDCGEHDGALFQGVMTGIGG